MLIALAEAQESMHARLSGGISLKLGGSGGNVMEGIGGGVDLSVEVDTFVVGSAVKS